jgi:GNAT superfamily N-acetyltransferase
MSKHDGSCEIRPIAVADAAAYASLRTRALVESPQAFSSDPVTDASCTAAGVIERLANPDCFMLGAFAAGELVGVATLLREKKPKLRHRADVVGVYVAPEVRGQGIAKALMLALEQRAEQLEGLLVLNLAVTRTQEHAVALYRSLGYQPWGVEPMGIMIEGRLMEGVFMQKRVSAKR